FKDQKHLQALACQLRLLVYHASESLSTFFFLVSSDSLTRLLFRRATRRQYTALNDIRQYPSARSAHFFGATGTALCHKRLFCICSCVIFESITGKISLFLTRTVDM
ncbi:MAG: hypothetical protein AB7U29_21030, partial [Desulfobulbus sp.]